MLPPLSADDVERYVAAGREASARTRAGDAAGAEAAYRRQIRIYAQNAEPYLALAFLAAGRGDEKAALVELRAAVVRGYTDLQRVARAEAGVKLGKSMGMLALEDAIPMLQKTEADWAGWGFFKADTAPRDLDEAIAVHGKLHERVALMALALGPRQVRLWKRVIDRSTAALLETYVTKKKDAPDLDVALTRLMAIYSGGSLLRWQAPPAAVTGRLVAVSQTALGRGADSALRPGALTLSAIAQAGNRDAQGALVPAAADWIRAKLGEVVMRYPDSPFVAVATTGLVRTEAETGRMDKASEVYRSFVARNEGRPALVDGVRSDLGDLALRAGGLPAFRATMLDGGEITSDSLRGKVAVFDFWATWCRPCADGFPTLRKIEDKHGDRVSIIGVSLDDLPVDELKAWIATTDLAGRHHEDGDGWDSEFVRKFGVKEIPFTVVVGADGSVLAINEHGKDLEKAVAAALTKN